MKTWFIILLSVILIGESCSNKKNNTQKPVPTILEGKHIDVSSIYKKRGGELIDALYDELVSKSEQLQQVEESIRSLQEQQKAAVDSFQRFAEKNKNYYESANKKLNTFSDSLLKKKMQAMIAASQQAYQKNIADHLVLDSLIKKKNTTIKDLHQVLKISATLPLIELYQQQTKPGTVSMQDFNLYLDSLTLRIDSIGTNAGKKADTAAIKK